MLKESRKFKKHRQLFKKVFTETKRVFRVMQGDTVNVTLLEESGIHCDLPKTIVEQCQSLSEFEPVVAVFGQTNYAKAVTINLLFKKAILPVDSMTTSSLWNPILLSSTTADAQLPPLLLQNFNFTNVAVVNDNYSAILECVADMGIDCSNREIMPRGINVTISSTVFPTDGIRFIIPATYRRQSVEEVSDSFDLISQHTLPILVYAIEREALTPWDLIELTELRRLAIDQCFLFIVVPSPEVYAAKYQPRTHVVIRQNSPVRSASPKSSFKSRKSFASSMSIIHRTSTCGTLGELGAALSSVYPIDQAKVTEVDLNQSSMSSTFKDSPTLPEVNGNQTPTVKQPACSKGDSTDNGLQNLSVSGLVSNAASSSWSVSYQQKEVHQSSREMRLLPILTQLGFLARSHNYEVSSLELAASNTIGLHELSLTEATVKTTSNVFNQVWRSSPEGCNGDVAEQTNLKNMLHVGVSHFSQECVKGHRRKGRPTSERKSPLPLAALLEEDLPPLISELCVELERDFQKRMAAFLNRRLTYYIISTLNALSAATTECLNGLITQAYAIAYDLMTTPKMLKFARQQEAQLYASLVSQTQIQRAQIFDMIGKTLEEMRETLPTQVVRDVDLSDVVPVYLTSRSETLTKSLEEEGLEHVRLVTPRAGHAHSDQCGAPIGRSSHHAHEPIADDYCNEVSQPSELAVSEDVCKTTPSTCTNRCTARHDFAEPYMGDIAKCSAPTILVPADSTSSPSAMQPRCYKRNMTIGRNGNRFSQAQKLATDRVRDYILRNLNTVISERVLQRMDVLQKSCIGTLERVVTELECLSETELRRGHFAFHLPDVLEVDEDSSCSDSSDQILKRSLTQSQLQCDHSSNTPSSAEHRASLPATLDPDAMTPTNLNFADVPRNMTAPPNFSIGTDGFTEGSNRSSPTVGLAQTRPVSTSAVTSLKALLRFSYGLSIQCHRNSYSWLKFLFLRMRDALAKGVFWQGDVILDEAWKRRVALGMLSSLSEVLVAKEVCAQLSDRLRVSHDAFLQTIRRLETRAEIRNFRFEEAQEKIRRKHAPKLARQVLDIVSLRNAVAFGLPCMGKEIGRGQYGTVFTCCCWGPHRNLAVKSVIPPDDKHFRDLALEVHYCRQLPPHDRLVTLHGTVVDYSNRKGSSAVVLFIMERLTRDLFTAIRHGLDWLSRLQVAMDVVEGIRFLHSQGLVHRDIKPRNVLLDQNNRAKLTDLGFCKPISMITGSVIGTPVHMAPEIFEKTYNTSVDIYAFGILFWYICAGKVNIPTNFEQCKDKDTLWTNVKRGLRPERLGVFTTECWELMKICWATDSIRRPHSGQVFEMLTKIYAAEFHKRQKMKPCA